LLRLVVCQDRNIVDAREIGSQLRALRTAEGRTVASVATVAGLSVPYIANLENGRGNPTLTALSRLAEALGTRLDISLIRGGEERGDQAPPVKRVPPSLVRLSRTVRFRQAAGAMAAAAEADTDEISLRLVGALAALSQVLGAEPAESDWLRLLDAVLLIAVCPAG
jgi:transcriptional regulator with XRE-family HTH domain